MKMSQLITIEVKVLWPGVVTSDFVQSTLITLMLHTSTIYHAPICMGVDGLGEVGR